MKDVIATDPSKFDQAKKRVEQRFVESKAQHRGRFAVVQRVRDQLDQAYNNAPADTQLCLEQPLERLA